MSEPPANPLRSELADRLDEASVAQVVEYLAHRITRRFSDGHSGHWRLCFDVEGGYLRRGEMNKSQIGVAELEWMGGREK